MLQFELIQRPIYVSHDTNKYSKSEVRWGFFPAK